MRLNAITDQTESFLNSSNGADPLTLKVGTSSGPATIEPVESWDSASNDVLEQVVETLFYYDLTDVDLPRINLLAESYHWFDTTHLDIKLREGILFHDGTPFNAVAAKWNLDRLLYLTNCTGTNTGAVAITQTLWMFPDGVTPIINNVATVGTYNISITLNGAYVPLLSTLSYINAGMISPTAHASEATSFIDLTTGQPIGTGPFRYEYFVPGVEVRFTRWDNYWKGPAYFEEMIFVIFYDATTAHNAMLSHEIDILFIIAQQNLPLYDADPNIMVKRFTEETGKPSLIYQYMGINNNKHNVTWRKAMALAMNYTYVIEELRGGEAIRATSAISPGFGGTYNSSIVPIDLDIAAARTIMQSMGFGVGFTTDAEWTSATFLSIPYTYNLGNMFRVDLYVAVQYWFDLIGIDVVDDGVTWPEFLNYLFNDYDHLGLFVIGWAPDYLDPYNMLDPLFNPASSSNSAQVNDAKLNTMMASALSETNEAARNIIYQNIQGYMADYGFFHIPLYHPKVTYVHLKEIQGVPYNAMGSFHAYPIYRATPGSFSLSSDAGSPDDDGTFTLTWSLANGADNYSVYQYSGYITEINGSLTLIADEITDLSLLRSSYPDGTYYFIVAAINEHGYTLSNCINVVVEITNDHDLEVDLDIPTGIEIDTSYIINATVQNIGLNDEFDVELYLYLDEVLINSITIPTLAVGTDQTIQYAWTPTEYRAYNFTALAPPVPLESYLDNNRKTTIANVIETQLFDGLYIKNIFYTFYNSNFTYTPYTGNLYNETFGVESMGTHMSYTWLVDALTRIMSGGSMFVDGAHTPAWIFTSTSLYDTIPISVDGEGDHDFYVARELIYDLPGFGPVGVWELEDLTQPGGIAWYEKSTGILLNGTFFYAAGAANYTFDFVDTNAILTIIDAPPGDFTLSSNAGDPDTDGIFDFTWTAASGATNYSVYRSSSLITAIDGSATLLADEITDLTFALSGYSDGTYYFIVVANNDNGDTLSNCIQVNVEFPGPPGDFTLSSNAGEPDTDGIFALTWTTASGANSYSVYRSSSFITAIDGSVTLLANEITDLNYALSGYEDGTYYFIVVAYNDNGDTLSNCVEITVEKPIVPGYDIALVLLTMLGITYLIIKPKLKRNSKLKS
ncbi:MAG: ABC transporter substrate-binding protein [Promethearchaeota archaeon]